jgi:hypothetical protein
MRESKVISPSFSIVRKFHTTTYEQKDKQRVRGFLQFSTYEIPFVRYSLECEGDKRQKFADTILIQCSVHTCDVDEEAMQEIC